MGAAIFDREGHVVKTVKNLGWLLRNWKLVRSFEVIKATGGRDHDAVLIGVLDSGFRYMVPFASRDVLAKWLDRPVFHGLTVEWFGRPHKIGAK